MATTLADAYVRLRPDGRVLGPELKQQTDRAAGEAGTSAGSNFAGRMGKAIAAGAAVAAAAVGTVLVKNIGASVNAARDLNEVSSKIGVVFGDNADNVRQWAQNMATDFGQSQKVALDGAATFAIYGKSAKLAGSDLFNFSTDMSGLASDLASFSNTSPEEAIQAMGAAFRGESDPIEKYGILLNETVIKNRALKLGLIETTTAALTPQQRILAVQAELYAQSKDAMGDFGRTSGSLANQQRILSANFENLQAKIGQALLPVVTKLVVALNTRLMPALNDLWAKHGPQITAWLNSAADDFGGFIGKIGDIDFASIGDRLKGAFAQIGPALASVKKEGGPQFADTLKVGGEVMKFMAKHSDTLAKALPYLVAGLIAAKTAQLAANVAQALSPALTIAAALANRRLAASNVELAAAMSANTAALTVNATSTVANSAATNTGILARGRAIVSMVAHKVALVASTAASWLATAATTALGVAVNFATGPIGLIIIAVAALAAGIIYLWKNNETFRKLVIIYWKAVQAYISFVWNNILKPVFNALVWYVKNVIIPAYQFLWEKIKQVFTFIKDYITKTIDNVKKILGVFGNFVREKVAPAFARGVDAIRTAWAKVQDAAKKPVRFVVDTVINGGIIGTFNKVAGFLGIKTRIPNVKVPGLSGGGYFDGMLPGPPSDEDNLLARGPGGRPIALAGGEYVVNARATAQNRALLEAVNSGNGYADGGFMSFIRNPVGWVRSRLAGPISNIKDKFGSNPFVEMLTGFGSKMKDGLISSVKSKVSSWFGAGGSNPSGGWTSQTIMAALRTAFPGLPLISGFRPGSTTLTGNRSYHASNRAVDVPPRADVFHWAKRRFGRAIRELIFSPMGARQVWEGRDHYYTEPVRGQHWNHVHLALAGGGRVPTYDRGGRWPSGTIGANMSGHDEVVASAPTMADLIALMVELISAVRAVAPGVGRELNGVGSSMRMLARGRA
jgi:hypothetical protein